MKKENGSIAIFALVALLFMTAFLIISYANITNKSKSLKEQFNIIQGIYYKSDDDSSYEDVYTDLRKKNRQTLTAYIENSNMLELEKTFTSKLSDYKIYGNTIQNGTPSIENPVELKSVGDKTKNLFDESLLLENSKISKTTEGYKVAGYPVVFYSTNNLVKKLKETLKPNTSYTLTRKVSNYIDNSSGMIQIRSTSSALVSVRYGDGIKSTTFTLTQEQIDSIDRIYIYGKVNPNETIFEYIQLEEGDTATSYEPYGYYKIPVEVNGKNILNIDTSDSFVGNLKVSHIEDGLHLTKSTSKESTSFLSFAFNCKPNTNYVVSGKVQIIKDTSTAGINNVMVRSGLTAGTIIKSQTYKKTDTSEQEIHIEFNSGEYTTLYLWLYLNSAKIDPTEEVENKYTNLMIEEGTTVTKYEQYKGVTLKNIYLDEPLRKVGNVSDYIDFKNKKVVRNVRYLSFAVADMNNIEDYPGWKNVPYISDEFPDLNTRLDSVTSVMDNITGLNNGAVGINTVRSKNNSLLFFNKSEIYNSLTQTQWKEQYPNLVFELIYVLPTAIEQSIELQELPSYEDYTKIQVLTEVSPSRIDVEYDGYTITE